jgi:hypothetical protein
MNSTNLPGRALRNLALEKKRAQEELDKALLSIEPGYFIQIERVKRTRSISLIAQKFHADKKSFRRTIQFFFEDAADALCKGEQLVISVLSC